MIVPSLIIKIQTKGHGHAFGGDAFGVESDVPPLCSPGSALISDTAEKAELLSAWFDSKQSRDIVELS